MGIKIKCLFSSFYQSSFDGGLGFGILFECQSSLISFQFGFFAIVHPDRPQKLLNIYSFLNNSIYLTLSHYSICFLVYFFSQIYPFDQVQPKLNPQLQLQPLLDHHFIEFLFLFDVKYHFLAIIDISQQVFFSYSFFPFSFLHFFDYSYGFSLLSFFWVSISIILVVNLREFVVAILGFVEVVLQRVPTPLETITSSRDYQTKSLSSGMCRLVQFMQHRFELCRLVSFPRP